MADEYNSTSNWWDSSSRTRFDTNTGSSSSSSSSNSSSSSTLASFSWPSHMVDHVKPSMDHPSSSSLSDNDHLHIINLGLSSPPIHWNQPLLSREGGEDSKNQSSFRSMLQGNSNYLHQQQQQQESSGGQVEWGRDSSLNDHDQFNKQIHQRGFSLDQPQFSRHESSTDSSVTCQGFQIDSSSIYGSPSPMSFQGLLGSDNQHQQQSYGANYGISTSNELVPCWSKVPQFLRNSPPKQASQTQLHFSNDAPFWNASAGSMNDVRPPGFFDSIQPQFPATNFEEKPKNIISQVGDSSTTVKKSGNGAATKRPRNETASAVPAFKVRKEKMGDRITALQQLVSPFGKTDTASVLSEAIEYIKFLHEQVTVLSSPYMKSGGPITHQQSCNEKSKEEKEDLRSRGLCLVPLTSTFPVTHESSVDIWSPTFGGYR